MEEVSAQSGGQQSRLRAIWKGCETAESGHVPQNLPEQGAASEHFSETWSLYSMLTC